MTARTPTTRRLCRSGPWDELSLLDVSCEGEHDIENDDKEVLGNDYGSGDGSGADDRHATVAGAGSGAPPAADRHATESSPQARQLG